MEQGADDSSFASGCQDRAHVISAPVTDDEPDGLVRVLREMCWSTWAAAALSLQLLPRTSLLLEGGTVPMRPGTSHHFMSGTPQKGLRP